MRGKSFLVFVFAIALAATMGAQTKISGTEQCKPEPSTPVAIGDKPDHAFAIGKDQCTWPKPIEMAGVQTKEAGGTAVSEMTGDTWSEHGYHLCTMTNGDKFWVSFRGTGHSKDGKAVSDGGTWVFTEGTGKLKGIKGKGTYKGTAGADGSMTFQIDGEYQLP
ncbi:MAG TPA: hypothetical protein VLO07_09630 [Thermoanaerobaculia bacterium]|nr:hypothetical protein [Thermoanaerobaculia bacterium]